jgi:hypothetical protein
MMVRVAPQQLFGKEHRHHLGQRQPDEADRQQARGEAGSAAARLRKVVTEASERVMGPFRKGPSSPHHPGLSSLSALQMIRSARHRPHTNAAASNGVLPA